MADAPAPARPRAAAPARLALVFALAAAAFPWGNAATAAPVADAEPYLADLVQLTRGGENAEGYWSPDGTELVFQATRGEHACDQIFRLPADGSGAPRLVSSGEARTTCAYFGYPDGERILYATTGPAAGGAAGCPPPPDRSQGYVWPLYPDYDIVSVAARGDDPDLRRLTDAPGYDAEATVCPLDGSIVFTSVRDGDLDLYRMDADGSNVRRLTDTPGYDGGAFFSPDCSKIVWRASRPRGEALEDYRRLLGQNLVRPGRLEIWVANSDGTEARQVTYLGAASFAPSFFPSGERIIFSTNYPDARSREFELWAIDLDGTDLERITRSPGFDGFPIFSPDGTRLAFSSNRDNTEEGETNVFVAQWVGGERGEDAAAEPESAADRFAADVAWLADDAREGRGLGTEGIEQAAAWIAARFAALGLEPAGDDGTWRHRFEVPVAVEAVPAGTRLAIDGRAVAARDFEPTGFSASGRVAGEVVAAGHGIVAPELGIDDYAGRDVAGKIVAVRRFVPSTVDDPDAERRYGDLRHKAFTAREKGAAAVIVVDLPDDEEVEEAPLPALRLDTGLDAGIPVVLARRAAAGRLFDDGTHTAEVAVELEKRTASAWNVVARLPGGRVFGSGAGAGAGEEQVGQEPEVSEGYRPHEETFEQRQQGSPHDPQQKEGRAVASLSPRAGGEGGRGAGWEREEGGDPVILLGAHYDHLGFGGDGHGSLDPDATEPHNGADDNASGVAALLEAARRLAERREAEGPLPADVVFVAFSAEESGLIGSTAFTREPPGGLEMERVRAMINLDMVGRLRAGGLSVLGADSAAEWRELVPPLCEALDLACSLGGDGYGPSDQTAFYAAGVPVLHLFTGIHDDYHKPSDDAGKVNAAGGARVAALTADLAAAVARRGERLAYRRTEAPAPQGDSRSYGASLGTVPDYAAGDEPGVPLAGVRPGSAAEDAGMARGDRLVELGGVEIRDIYDFMYVLRQAKPGETTTAVVVRDGERLTLEVTYGSSSRLR